MFEELDFDVIRRREINDNVLSKLINKQGKLSVKISADILKGIPTVNFSKIMDNLANEVYLEIFPWEDGKYPTKVKSGNYKEIVYLRYFEIMNILDKSELL